MPTRGGGCCGPRGDAAGAAPPALLDAVRVPLSSAWGRMVDGIASKLAFFPPSPASYTVEEHQDGTGQLYIQPVDRACPRVASARVAWLKTPHGSRVVSAFLPYLDGRGGGSSWERRLTLLYSHGNAVDLGQILPLFRDLSRLLHVNVLAYDYTGYGASSGAPSVAATCGDLAAVLAAAEAVHGVRRQQVVLYGQSVGSGPTVWLAAQRPGVAGVILHSPLLSGVRVFNPGLKWWPTALDVFPNHSLVKRVDVPLLVLHGTADEVIHYSAGQRLAQLAPGAVPPLLAEGYDHHNLEASPDYLPRIQTFLGELQQRLKSQGQPRAQAAAPRS